MPSDSLLAYRVEQLEIIERALRVEISDLRDEQRTAIEHLRRELRREREREEVTRWSWPMFICAALSASGGVVAAIAVIVHG